MIRQIALRVTFLLWILSLLSTASSQAQDFLEKMPESYGGKTKFGDDPYHTNVRTAFSPVFQKDCLLNIVIIPSFLPEEALAIRQTTKGYEAVYVTLDKQLWTFEDLQSRLSQDPLKEKEIRLKISRRPIKKERALELIAIWKTMIDTSKNQTTQTGCDGETYYFSYKNAHGKTLSAEAWSPETNGRNERLTTIAWALLAYARHEIADWVVLREIEEFKNPGSIPVRHYSRNHREKPNE